MGQEIQVLPGFTGHKIGTVWTDCSLPNKDKNSKYRWQFNSTKLSHPRGTIVNKPQSGPGKELEAAS